MLKRATAMGDAVLTGESEVAVWWQRLTVQSRFSPVRFLR